MKLLLPSLVLSLLSILVLPAVAGAQDVGVFGGVVTGGEAELAIECSGSCTGFQNQTTNDADDDSGVVLGADVIFPVNRSINVGAGLFYTNGVEYDKSDLGSDMLLVGIGELRRPLSPSMDIAFRVNAGAHIVFPGGEWEDVVESTEDDCAAAPSTVKCDVDDGPYLGLTAGASAGLRFDLGDVEGRADLHYSYIKTSILELEVDNTTLDYTLEGHRVWLLVGVNFES